MANELRAIGLTTGLTNITARLTGVAGTIYNTGTTALETYTSAHGASYCITLTESASGSQIYLGSFPSALNTQGDYFYDVWQGVTGTPADTLLKSTERLLWNGSALIPWSELTVNLTQILGTAVSTPATAGILDVNLKNVANAAVSTTSAQLGVNAVNIGGTAAGSSAIGSVTGAVGSVTGNVGGNVTGSTASVTGNIGGNVNGNVNGNVSGSVGSVTGAVGSVTGNVGGNIGGNVDGNVAGSTASVAGSVGSVAGGLGGDVAGKVLGGGSSSISGAGVRADAVTGNVAGSTGSVTGAVGSVTGNVGGNVAGSVGSVVANVEIGSYATGQDPWAQLIAQSQFSAMLSASGAANWQYKPLPSVGSTQVVQLYASDGTTKVAYFTVSFDSTGKAISVTNWTVGAAP